MRMSVILHTLPHTKAKKSRNKLFPLSFAGAGWGARTPDLMITNQALYRLS